MGEKHNPSVDPDDLKTAKRPTLEGAKANEEVNNPMGRGYRRKDGESVHPDDLGEEKTELGGRLDVEVDK